MSAIEVTRSDDGKIVLQMQHGDDQAFARMTQKTALWLAGQLMAAANVSVLVGALAESDSPSRGEQS